MISVRRVQAGTSSFYGLDPMGNTCLLTDGNGNVTDRYNYKAFGDELSGSGSTPNPHRFGGEVGYYRDKIERVYIRARHYAPDTGRWMSRDPIGFAGGDFNLYRYVGNNPTNFGDPYGLSDVSLGEIFPYFRNELYNIWPIRGLGIGGSADLGRNWWLPVSPAGAVEYTMDSGFDVQFGVAFANGRGACMFGPQSGSVGFAPWRGVSAGGSGTALNAQPTVSLPFPNPWRLPIYTIIDPNRVGPYIDAWNDAYRPYTNAFRDAYRPYRAAWRDVYGW